MLQPPLARGSLTSSGDSPRATSLDFLCLIVSLLCVATAIAVAARAAVGF